MGREERYHVAKVKDVAAALNPTELSQWSRLHLKINLHRESQGKPEMKCVVVESDWPEYEPTWKAIEKRVNKDEIRRGVSEYAEKLKW